MKHVCIRKVVHQLLRARAITAACLGLLLTVPAAALVFPRIKLPPAGALAIERPAAAMVIGVPELRTPQVPPLAHSELFKLAEKLEPHPPLLQQPSLPLAPIPMTDELRRLLGTPAQKPLAEAVVPAPKPLGEAVAPVPRADPKPSAWPTTFEGWVQQRPAQVLAQFSVQAGDIAVTLSTAQQRRALVVVGHADKLSLAGLQRQRPLARDEVLDIADTICAIVAEAALPTDTFPMEPSVLADRFVSKLELARDTGLHSLDPDGKRVWARAMQAANDPSMLSSVSGIRKNYSAGTVSFQISHPKFSVEATYKVFGFALEVGKNPNQPDASRLARLWR